MRIFTTVFLFFILSLPCSVQSFADQKADSIEKFFPSITGQFMGTRDPAGDLVLSTSGGIVQLSYSGIDREVLNSWEGEDQVNGTHRIMRIGYSLSAGAFIEDLLTGQTFELVSGLKEHPIDLALGICQENAGGDSGLFSCGSLALDAWDVELNRAYNALGGDGNATLRKAQIEWIKYRDATINYLSEEYDRDGTVWNLVYMGHVLGLTRTQANLLQSIKAW